MLSAPLLLLSRIITTKIIYPAPVLVPTRLLFARGVNTCRIQQIFPALSEKKFLSSTSSMSNKKALIIASDGSEDTELMITSDVLRRAGVDVTIAGLQDKERITLSQKASLNVDKLFKECEKQEYDAVILPGGPGSDKLAEDKRVGEILRHHESAGKIVAAICGAPIAFKSHKIGVNGKITSYPKIRQQLEEAGYHYVEEPVCVSNNMVTSRGPGTAFHFALKLVEMLVGDEKAKSVADAVLICTSALQKHDK